MGWRIPINRVNTSSYEFESMSKKSFDEIHAIYTKALNACEPAIRIHRNNFSMHFYSIFPASSFNVSWLFFFSITFSFATLVVFAIYSDTLLDHIVVYLKNSTSLLILTTRLNSVERSVCVRAMDFDLA